MEVTQHAPGNFCWTELATSDQDGAKQFYTSLFGWGFEDFPMGEGMGVYTMLNKGGKTVGALHHDTMSGAPPHWTCYVRVSSADEAADKVKSLGGTVIMGPFDVMEHGRMVVLQDPTGAFLCVWEPKQHPGAQLIDEPGAFCWYELNTRDTHKAKTFYSQLFDWGVKESEGGSMEYTEYQVSGKSIAGMMEITPQMGPIPPNWLPYIQVEDCDSTVAKAQGLNGNAIVPGMDIPHVGRFAILQDPQGAVFAIVALSRG